MIQSLSRQLWILIAMLCVSFTASAYDFEVDGFYYKIVSIGEKTASLAGPKDAPIEELTIPSSVEYLGNKVSIIGVDDSAFKENKFIKKVIIPPHVQWLGDECFYKCESLNSVIIEESDSPLDSKPKRNSRSFFEESSVRDVYIGRVVTGSDAFADCGYLKNVTFANSVTEIGEFMFSMSPIESITLPNNCSKINDGAFFRCNNLTEIKNASKVSIIGANAFSYCKTPFSFDSPLNELVEIGDYAFMESGLTSLSCDNLQTIGPSGTSAFFNCLNLRFVSFGDSPLKTIPSRIFPSCPQLTEFIIPKFVETIEDDAFYASSLESIVFPGNVKTMGLHVFKDCTTLKSLTFEYGETPLFLAVNFAFPISSSSSNNDLLNSIEYLTINRDIETKKLDIGGGWYASGFETKGLKELKIGEYVQSINSPFYIQEADNLSSIKIEAPIPPKTSNWNFTTKQKISTKLLVPQGSKEAYQSATPWKDFWNIEEFDSSSTDIEDIYQESKTMGDFEIYDIQGRKIHQVCSEKEIPNLTPGIYIVKSDKGVRKIKI